MRWRRRLKRAVWAGITVAVACSMTACGSSEVATVSNEDEAIEIVTVLYDNGVDATKQEAGEDNGRQWKVFVSNGDQAKAYRILHDNGLPRPSGEGREGAGKEDGLLKSVSAEKARRLKEVETEIERELRMLPGVIRVKANVAPAEDDILELKAPEATASVVLVTKDKEPKFSAEHVKSLVAGAVPKLKGDNVRVTIAYDPPRAPSRRSDASSRRRRLVRGGAIVALLSLLFAALAILARRRSVRPADALATELD